MRLLITAGPTREPIDAVRYISNRSSGQMGLALAQAGVDAGHEVALLLGPGPGDDAAPPAARVFRFQTAADLRHLLESHWPEHDVLIMAAAVADYRPAKVYPGKLRRSDDQVMHLELEPIEDAVAQMAFSKRANQRVIAFALEPGDSLIDGAAKKLVKKGVDAIVANPLKTMDAKTIDAHWLASDGGTEHPGAMSKQQFAQWLINKASADMGL